MSKKLSILLAILCVIATGLSAAALSIACRPEEPVDIQYVMYLGTNDKDTYEPYGTPEEAKAKVVYRKVSIMAGILLAIQGLLPAALVLLLTDLGSTLRLELMVFFFFFVMYFLYLLIWRRLRGYTGDCCGALCLLVELAAIVTAVVQL